RYARPRSKDTAQVLPANPAPSRLRLRAPILGLCQRQPDHLHQSSVHDVRRNPELCIKERQPRKLRLELIIDLSGSLIRPGLAECKADDQEEYIIRDCTIHPIRFQLRIQFWMLRLYSLQHLL